MQKLSLCSMSAKWNTMNPIPKEEEVEDQLHQADENAQFGRIFSSTQGEFCQPCCCIDLHCCLHILRSFFSNTDMQLEEMGVRTAQEISAESWSTCSLLCSSSNAPKGGKLRPKSRQLSRVSALEGFGWRFSVCTRYYVFVSFVREGVGDYGLDLNIEFGRRILITEEGEWLLNSVLQCNAGLDRDMFLDAQASLALTPASPFVRHTFGFPFCQHLWAITKRLTSWPWRWTWWLTWWPKWR